MTVYASTAALTGTEDLWQRLDRLEEAGISAVELGAGVKLEPFGVENLASRLTSRGHRWLVHNYFPPPEKAFFLNLASASEDIRKRSLALVETAITLTAHLGGQSYSVHAGWVTDPIGRTATGLLLADPQSDDALARAEDRFVASVEHALAIADVHGVELLVENNVCTPALLGKVLLADIEGFRRLFDRVASDRFGVLLDTGHLRVAGTTLDFDPCAVIESLGSRIRAFHVHDNDGTADSHEPARERSWVFDVLAQPQFANASVVVEAQFSDARALADHLKLFTA